MSNEPTIDETAEGAMRVSISLPITPAKLRRAGFMLDSIATSMEEAGEGVEVDDEDPTLAAAAVLDDVRAVMLGRGREFGFTNEIVNIVSLPGGTMGVSVTRRDGQEPIVCIAFGACGGRADMRERLGLAAGEIVPALSYIEITDFDREGVSHLIGAIKLAYPDLLEPA